MLWETHLHHRAQRPGSDSPAHSSGLGDKAGSYPGSGSVGLGCSSPEGRGTGWRIWCLKNKVQRNESSWAQDWGGRPCYLLLLELLGKTCCGQLLA